jgi:hypothetical protein
LLVAKLRATNQKYHTGYFPKSCSVVTYARLALSGRDYVNLSLDPHSAPYNLFQQPNFRNISIESFTAPLDLIRRQCIHLSLKRSGAGRRARRAAVARLWPPRAT